MKWPQHGSNTQYLYESISIPRPEHWIDFSANINPLGPPRVLKQKWSDFYEKISDYPDPQSLALKNAIAQKENVSRESILIGNGAAEIITIIGRMIAGKKVLIMEPAFSEYEKACLANDCHILYYSLKAPTWKLQGNDIAEKIKNVNAIFLCNPNNPTGVRYSYSTILEILEVCRQMAILLIIDEAFYDFLEDYVPITPLIKEYPNLVILRSMTKMFAIPGLRLGYALANPAIVERMSVNQPQWNVNILAMLAGEACLKEDGYIQDTIKFIRQEREKLFSFFQKEGYEFSPSSTNFYLLRDPEQKDQFVFFKYLLQKGIVPRHTFNFPGLEGKWLRFAVKGEEDNNRLMEVLFEWKHLH